MVGVGHKSQLILAEGNGPQYFVPSKQRGDGVMADDAAMEILKRIQASIVALDEKTQASLAALDEKTQASIAALDKKFTTQYTILAQDVRMIRGAIQDLVKTRVTAGEVDALHEDMNRLMTRVDALEHPRE